jgi:N-methylhydantoinase B/oxoprolinase/acetone carboxylase alpha subunit
LIRDGQKQALRSKVTNMMLRNGDIVRLETSGGGGFGEARLRARELVERDVRLGYVSAAAARDSYGQGG